MKRKHSIISATELKNKISDVVSNVYYSGEEVTISRHGKKVAKIVPVQENRTKLHSRSINDFFGILPDFPDVTKERRSGRRKVDL